MGTSPTEAGMELGRPKLGLGLMGRQRGYMVTEKELHRHSSQQQNEDRMGMKWIEKEDRRG